MQYFNSDRIRTYHNRMSALPSRKWPRIERQLGEDTSTKTWRIETPNLAVITISGTDSWDDVPEREFQSTALWKYSLGYLREILDDFEDPGACQEIIHSFSRYVRSDAWDQRLDELTSADHLVAELLSSLLYIYSDERFAENPDIPEIIAKLKQWARTPEMYKSNNHGMMLAVSILHSINFPLTSIDPHCIANGALSTPDRELTELANSKLIEILTAAFEPSGFCRENSPAYQAFYIRYMDSILQSIDVVDTMDDISDEIRTLRELAASSLTKISLPDGTLPPLGDGNLTQHGRPLKNRESVFFSRESGFFVTKDDRIYLSLKSGCSSVTHKHMDDTSIYLWANGEPVFSDGGLYNYDWKDERTLSVKSQSGHSGAFFRRFDDVYPASLYRGDNWRENIDATLELADSEHKTTLTARVKIKSEYEIERRLEFFHRRHFILRDTFHGPAKEPAVTRFLIPETFSVKIESNRVTLQSERNLIEISSDGSSISLNAPAQRFSPFSGWQATSFGVLEPAWLLEFNITTENDLPAENAISITVS